MKNILIIVANPRNDSLSSSIADKYKQVSLEKNCDVEVLDLYKDENQQAFFTFEDYSKVELTKETKYYQDKIEKADEIAFVFPYWWGSYPAILKNFFDWNLSAGFAFTYQDSGPVGLLTDKKAKVFVTTGAPKEYYDETGANERLRLMMKEQIIEFCGMEIESFNIYGGVDTGGKEVEEILESIK